MYGSTWSAVGELSVCLCSLVLIGRSHNDLVEQMTAEGCGRHQQHPIEARTNGTQRTGLLQDAAHNVGVQPGCICSKRSRIGSNLDQVSPE